VWRLDPETVVSETLLLLVRHRAPELQRHPVASVFFPQYEFTEVDESTVSLHVLRVDELTTLPDELWHLADMPLHSLLQDMVDALGSVVGPARARRLHILS